MKYIKWTVEDISFEAPSATSIPTIEVGLAGFIDNYGAVKSLSKKYIAQEIEDMLNKDGRSTVSYRDYVKEDIEATKHIYRNIVNSHYGANPGCVPAIKDVIFNPPATIVFWMDNTKTVVKCQDDDIFDPEKGLAMAISKKALGNRGNYYNEFQKWVGKYDVPCLYPNQVINFDGSVLKEAVMSVSDFIEKRIKDIKEKKNET